MRQTVRAPIDPSTPIVPSTLAANDSGRPSTPAPFASQPDPCASTSVAPTEEASDPARCSKSFIVQGATTTVEFHLRQVAGRLHVKREEQPHCGARSLQVVRFRSLHGFRRWCDHDALRFDAPLGHASLLRSGEELWGSHD